MEKDNVVVKVHGKWGLADWYPTRPRPKAKAEGGETETEKEPEAEDAVNSEEQAADEASPAQGKTTAA
jgi:hypothetical protein